MLGEKEVLKFYSSRDSLTVELKDENGLVLKEKLF